MKKYTLIVLTALLACFITYAQEYVPNTWPYRAYNTTASEIISKGSLDTLTIYGPALESNLFEDSTHRNALIYLPPGYENTPDNRYPVLYLLHGYGLDESLWFSRRIGKILLDTVMDYMLNENLVAPLIVVSVSSKNKYNGSFYTNSLVTGQWEDFHVKDVVQFIDTTYRTLPYAASRGIGGFSMGGYGAMKFAMKHPSVFSAVYSHGAVNLDMDSLYMAAFKDHLITAAEGGCDNFENLNWEVRACFASAAAFAPNPSLPCLGELPLTANGELIDSVWQKWLQHEPITMLPAYIDSMVLLKGIQFDVGDGDIWAYESGVLFSQALEDNEINHVFEVYNGDHGSKLRYRLRDHALPFFSQHLEHQIPGISLQNSSLLGPMDTIIAVMDTDGLIYVVPENTLAIRDSLNKNKVTSKPAQAFSEARFPVSEIAAGNYVVYGIDTVNNAITIPKSIVISESSYSPTPHKSCKILINPNPVNDFLFVKAREFDEHIVEIHSLNGQLIVNADWVGTTLQIDLSSFQKGVYFITVKSGNYVKTEKVIKL